MRRRRIIMFFATIMSVAIIAVGFAAWIITAPTDDSINNGSIAVEEIEVEGWEFNTYWVDSLDYVKANGETGKLNDNPVIKFGKSTSGNTYSWLENGSVDFTENLVAYLYVEGNPVKNASEKYEIKDSASISLSFVKAGSTIDAPNVINSNITTKVEGVVTPLTSITPEQLTNGIVIAINFEWKTPQLQETDGVVTETANVANVNPYFYFNGFKYSETAQNAAFTYLNNIQEKLDGVSFRVTLKGITATE